MVVAASVVVKVILTLIGLPLIAAVLLYPCLFMAAILEVLSMRTGFLEWLVPRRPEEDEISNEFVWRVFNIGLRYGLWLGATLLAYVAALAHMW